MDGAGTTLRNAAAKLGAGKIQVIPQYPKEGGVGFNVERVRFAIHGKRDHAKHP